MVAQTPVRGYQLCAAMKPHFGKLLPVVLALAAHEPSAFANLGVKSATATGGIAGARKVRAPQLTWLGVRIAEASPEISGRLPIEPGTGLVVDQVIPDSPAAVAGLQRGDVLARLNEQTLVTPLQLQTLVMHRKPGDQVEVTFFRKGERRKVVVVLMLRERM